MLANAYKTVSIFSKLTSKLLVKIIYLYKSCIRPLLEYGSVVWHGRTSLDSPLIERVQYECSLTTADVIMYQGAFVLFSPCRTWIEKLSDRRHIIQFSITSFMVKLDKI